MRKTIGTPAAEAGTENVNMENEEAILETEYNITEPPVTSDTKNSARIEFPRCAANAIFEYSLISCLVLIISISL